MNITKELKEVVSQKYRTLQSKRTIEERTKLQKKHKVELQQYLKIKKERKKLEEQRKALEKQQEKLQAKLRKNNAIVYHGYDEDPMINICKGVELKKTLAEVFVELQYSEKENVLETINNVFKQL